MNTLRVLYVTTELSPFTGASDRGKECYFLSRGLADLGLAVTVIVPTGADGDPAAHGLARRLSPLSLSEHGDSSPSSVTVHEGTLPGGRVEVFAVATDSSGDAFCAAALALTAGPQRRPDVILAGNGSERVLQALTARASESSEAAPLVVFTLRDLTPSAELSSVLERCDRVVTSSPNWVNQLRKGSDDVPVAAATLSMLEPVAGRLVGVPAGIDAQEWNLRRDPYLSRSFADDPPGHKPVYKEELQRQLGLKVEPDTPLVALVGPLDAAMLPYATCNEICQRKLQLVALADAERDAKCLRGLSRLANQSSTRIAVRTPSEAAQWREFEHKLLAGADFALFARKFSPSALCELYCLHYGVIPIAPQDGSFADILVEFDSISNTGSGFLFKPGKVEQVVAAVDRALHMYRKADSRLAAIERALTMDLSWATAARRYAGLFLDIMREKGLLAA